MNVAALAPALPGFVAGGLFVAGSSATVRRDLNRSSKPRARFDSRSVEWSLNPAMGGLSDHSIRRLRSATDGASQSS